MEIVLEYTDKSFVVNGDTKPFKENLMALGGRYNPRLKGGPGFVFSNNKINDVKDFINNSSVPISDSKIPNTKLTPTPSKINYPNRFVGGDGNNYQIIIHTCPLPALDQKVTLKTLDNSYEYNVYKINSEAIVNDIDLIHHTSSAISRAVIINGEWKIFGMIEDHELIF